MPAPRPEQLAEQLHGVLEPVVADIGFELDELDVRATGRRRTVRLVVDSEDGVALDDIARVSRTVSAVLDQQEHLIGGSYTLEVTSPGVDRPLTAARHWRRARLRLVAVRRADGTTLTGRVGDAGEESVTLLVDGTPVQLRYADVAHARVEVEFRPPPEDEVRLLGARTTGTTVTTVPTATPGGTA
ncbi:MAG: ribosome maturation factor RimP [Pseudonocardia sp.]